MTPPAEDEVFKLRERLHRLNDTVQIHVGLLGEHRIRLEQAEKQIGVLTNQTATREQLDAAAIALGIKLANAMEVMSLQIKAIADDLAPIRKGVYWVITVVLGSILIAGLSLLLKRPGL